MNVSYRLLLAAALISSPLLAKSLSAQGDAPPAGRGRRVVPPKPVEHFPDGTVNLGITSKERGLWLPLDRTDLGRRSTLAPVETIPFQPWAKALYDDRQIHELEPHTRCKASGVSRQFQTPYGVDIVQMPDLKRIYIFDVGGPHTFRLIYMDGRPHPKDLRPSFYGHSVGRWEGETLVVETVGYSEDFWLDRTGLPHTEKLRTVERFTRTDFNVMKYEVLIDDPNVYTRPWSGGFNFRWSSNIELFEYVCQDNNTAPVLMMKGDEPLTLTKPFVP
ncbi:MAG TPA: hypothetical protein VE422_23900 [Terriglobia bacterium]|nr:hypothetical protein [Terriglobia bacterium]